MKKIISMLLAAILATALLAGCGTAGGGTPAPTPAPAADTGGTTPPAAADTAEESAEIVELHAVFSGAAPNDEEYVITAVNAALAEQGYNFTIRQTFMTDYRTNLALMIASGEVVDIAWPHMASLGDQVRMGVHGPLDPYFDIYAPDFAAAMPAHVRAQGTVGGVMYAAPRIIPMAQFNWVLNIRKDLREEWGLPEITSLELLEQYFARAYEEGMIPMHSADFRAMYAHYANFFFPMGNNGRYPMFVDPDDPNFEVRSFFDTEYFRNVVETRRRWRDNGWIPEDEAAFGGDANQGFIHGILATVHANIFSEAERTDQMHQMTPHAVIETITLNPQRRHIFQGGDNMMGTGSTTNNTREAVQFMNWIRKSQDNFDLWTYGVYGRNFVLDGESVSFDGIADDMRYVPRQWVWNDAALNRFPLVMPAEHVERLLNWDTGAIVTPFVGFQIDPENIRTEFSQLNAIMGEFIPIFEQGIIPYDDLIDEFMNQMWNAGLQAVIDATQVQLDDFLGR